MNELDADALSKVSHSYRQIKDGMADRIDWAADSHVRALPHSYFNTERLLGVCNAVGLGYAVTGPIGPRELFDLAQSVLPYRIEVRDAAFVFVFGSRPEFRALDGHGGPSAQRPRSKAWTVLRHNHARPTPGNPPTAIAKVIGRNCTDRSARAGTGHQHNSPRRLVPDPERISEFRHWKRAGMD